MDSKTVLYAAVGAPVVVARKVGDRVSEIRANLNKEASSLGKTANKRMTAWATEGEKVVHKITDAKMVDELTSKVDFDQVSTQVSKLRDQLEDMLVTWRASFRPEKLPTVKMEASASGVKVQAVPAEKAAPKATTRRAAPKATAKKAAPKATAKKTAPKAGAKKAAPKAGARKAPARKSVAAAS
jgi:hypothetical protein